MLEDNKNCFCCSNIAFEYCCKPILTEVKKAANSEALMRSRFTAYVLKDYAYILDTYAKKPRQNLSIQELAQSAENTQWLSLQVIGHSANLVTSQVEFKAFYKIGECFYVLHELSDFVLEDEKWRYSKGNLFKNSGEFKPQRNSQCLCGSGKKYKKCCGK
ncbi:MAG: YchJ family metal-binding protein [Paraglaciecola sp.]|uniref:YchJ family protein n=1 Tax=Paraglaciecola sp. TaxID=1920173 RepID=UPI00329A3514